MIEIVHVEQGAYAFSTDEKDAVSYCLGGKWSPPNYPVPAIQLRTKLDYSDIHPGKIIGLMLGNFTHGRLEKYWPRED